MSARSSFTSSPSAVSSAQARVAAYDWQELAGELDNYGRAVLPKLLSPEECRTIAALYPDESHFRATSVWRGTASVRAELPIQDTASAERVSYKKLQESYRTVI